MCFFSNKTCRSETEKVNQLAKVIIHYLATLDRKPISSVKTQRA